MFLFQQSVSAYIDPSTATYLVQIIAGILVAGGIAIGVFRHKIKRLFTKNKGDATSQDELADVQDDNLAD